MSELVIKGYRNGEPVYEEELTEAEINIQLRGTAEWKYFEERYDAEDARNQTLLNALYATRLGGATSVEPYQRLIRTINQAGGIVTLPTIKGPDNNVLVPAGQYEFVARPVPQPTPEPEIPRDKNGRPLSEAQIRWSEYRQFAETHSSQDCKNRAKADAGFASLLRTNLQREMTEGGVGDAVENLNARPEAPKTKVTPELLSWVAEYNRSSAEQVRKQKRADFNPLGHEQYNQNLEAAIAAGLI